LTDAPQKCGAFLFPYDLNYRQLYITLSIYATGTLSASFEHLTQPPLNVGLGLSYYNIFSNPAGSFMDPASSANQNNLQVSILSGQKFNLRQLTHHSVAAAFPIKGNGMAIGLRSFGTKQYRESIFSMGYGHKIKNRMSIGISTNLYALSIPGYGAAQSLGTSLSWHIQVTNQIKWGTILHNINGPTIGQSNDALPQLIISTIVFQPIRPVTVLLEWEQDTDYSSQIKSGFSIQPKPWLQIQTGYISNTGQMTGAIGLKFYSININYALANHPELGPSHWMEFHFPFRRK